MLSLCLAGAYCPYASSAWPQEAKQSSSQPGSDAGVNSQFLTSYEGQTVTAIAIAGRPDLDTAQFSSSFAQRIGEPFSQEKVEQTVEALKARGKFQDIELQVEPEANGVRILLILDPAVYFGIFDFPGAERLSYTRLVQVSNFSAQSPYNAEDVEQDRQSLLTYLRQEGYFEAEVQIGGPRSTSGTRLLTSLSKSPLSSGRNLASWRSMMQIRIKRLHSTRLSKACAHAFMEPASERAKHIIIQPLRAQLHICKTNSSSRDAFSRRKWKLAGAEYHADTNRADIHFSR